MTPARRWPIWPFIPAAIMVVIIPPIVHITIRVGNPSSDGMIAPWLLVISVAAGSLLSLAYGVVRSLSGEALDRRWRIRSYVAAAIMVIAIPPFVWMGRMIELTLIDLLDGRTIDLWQLATATFGGSLLALVFGMAHSLIVTMAIVGGTCILIHKQLDSIWVSLSLGAPLALIVLGIPPADGEVWLHLMIAGSAASTLNWLILVRPIRMRRLARSESLRPSPKT